MSPPSRSHITFIQVALSRSPYLRHTSTLVASHIHPAPENGISTPCRSHLTPIHNVSRHVSHLHPVPISIASRSQDLGLNSIQVAGHLHPGRQNCIPASCKTHLTSIHFSKYVYKRHQGRCLTSIQVPRLASHPIRVVSHPHLGADNTRYYTPQPVWPRFWLQVNKAGTCPGSPSGSLRDSLRWADQA